MTAAFSAPSVSHRKRHVNDQYGSVRAGMSGSTVLTKLEYYPYGEVYSMSGGGSVYMFLGKEDPGVGLLDFGPRYYNAMTGRFLSPDPILAGASAYAYCAGNPKFSGRTALLHVLLL